MDLQILMTGRFWAAPPKLSSVAKSLPGKSSEPGEKVANFLRLGEPGFESLLGGEVFKTPQEFLHVNRI
jgi:hypothetical protein